MSQPGDNPMQIQEMYWKQKYKSLEENYNILKNEYEKNQNSSKSETGNHTFFFKSYLISLGSMDTS